jgi:hypothetical protein
MTAERIYRIPQSDLDRVRITCQHKGCGKTVEMGVRDARITFEHAYCPFCQNPWGTPKLDSNPLVALWTAWQLLHTAKDQMQVEFIVPDPAA